MPQRVQDIALDRERDFKIVCNRIDVLRGVTDNKTGSIEELMKNKFSEIMTTTS